MLIYGLEACSLINSDLCSIDFVFSRFFMKLLRTNSIDTLMICYSYFGVNLPSAILRNRVIKFEQKFAEVHKVVV